MIYFLVTKELSFFLRLIPPYYIPRHRIQLLRLVLLRPVILAETAGRALEEAVQRLARAVAPGRA
jgi:hypothetical protein